MDDLQQYSSPVLAGKDLGVVGKDVPTSLFWRKKRFKILPWPLSLTSSVVLLIFLFALLFDFYRLGDPSVWFDEAFSVELSRLPLPTLFHIIWTSEANMGLYHVFLHFWLAFAGMFGWHQVEFLVRFPSAVFAAFCAVVIFVLGKRFIGIFASMVASILYVLCDLQLVYAQDARSYAMQTLFVCLSWLMLLMALRQKRTRISLLWVYYIGFNVLAVYAQLFSLLVLCAQGIAVVGILVFPNAWQASARAKINILIISAFASIIFMLPMIWSLKQGSKTGWLPIPHLNDVYHLFVGFADNNHRYFDALLLCVLVGGFIITASALVQGTSIKLRTSIQSKKVVGVLFSQQELFPFFWSLVCWIVIPVIMSYVLSQGSSRLFSSRYLVVIIPAFFLLVALGIKSLPGRVVQILLCLILIWLAYPGAPQYYRSAQVEDWNSASHWLTQRYQPNDGLVCYDNVQGCQISMEYYFHAYPASGAHFTPDSPGYFSWDKYGYSDPYAHYTDAINPHLVSAFALKHSRLFYIVGRADVSLTLPTQQWLNTHFTLVDSVKTPTVTVYLYATQKYSKTV